MTQTPPPDADPELAAAAEEEMRAAATLRWAELAKLVPWGDTYEGFGPAGGTLLFERGYIWKAEAGGDILCEVVAYRGASRYDNGVRLSRVIPKPRG